MSLKAFWQLRSTCRDTRYKDVHLVIEHPNYTFPGGVLSCSLFPFVATECTSFRVTHQYKRPTCAKCAKNFEWILTLEVLKELREKARVAGVLGK